MARGPVGDASALSKAAPSTHRPAQQSLDIHVKQRALAEGHESVSIPTSADAASSSQASQHQDSGRPIGFFEPFEKNGVRQAVFNVPGTDLLSLQAPPSTRPTLAHRILKRDRQDDISQVGEPNSSNAGPSRVKRRQPATSRGAAPRTHSAPKPRSQRQSRANKRSNSDDRDEEEDEDKTIAVLTVTTNELYLGDCAGMASFYEARLGEINQTFLKQIVTKWLHVLEPSRQRKYGAYVPKKTPKDLTPGTCPPWWPSTTPYVEPSHLGKEYIMPMAVDLMQIHRRSDKKKRDAFPSWILEMKKHVDYVISTCSLKVISSSTSSVFVDAMKETTIKVMNDMFQAALSHEDHLIQNDLFEEMDNEDDGRGKWFTWSAMPKPRRPSSKSKIKAASISEGSGDETEVDYPKLELVQHRGLSSQPTSQPLLQALATPNDVALTKTANSMSPPASQRPDAYQSAPVYHSPLMSVVSRALPPRPSSQTPSSSPDQSMNRYLPAVEARRNSEPHGQVFNEPQSYYSPSSYNAFGLVAMDREIPTYPSQTQIQFSPISEPELTRYSFQPLPTTMSTSAPIYAAQPAYTSMFVPDPSSMSYPLELPQNVQGYAHISPGSSMNRKMAMDCNSSFASTCSDVDMSPPELHGLPYVPSQLPFTRISYCNCPGQFCMCGAGQDPYSRR